MKNHITLAGKCYPVTIVNGEGRIDGKTVDEFIEWHFANGNHEELVDAVTIGRDSLNGTLPAGSAQLASDMLHAAREKRN